MSEVERGYWRDTRDEALHVLLDSLWRCWRADPPSLTLAPRLVLSRQQWLIRCGVPGLVWRKLRETVDLWDDADSYDEAQPELVQAYRMDVLESARQERVLEAVAARLHDAGVPVLFVKGWGLARLYPERGLRAYSDHDLCFPVGMLDAGRAALDCEEALRWNLDLHVGYPKLLGREFDDVLRRAQRAPLGATQVSLPSPEDHLRLLCSHWLVHGGCRPLWLCDLAVFVEAHPQLDWELVFRGSARHAQWIRATLALTERLVGADLSATPLAGEAERLPAWFPRAVLEQWRVNPEGTSSSGALSFALLGATRSPHLLARKLRSVWRNPLQATVELGAPLNRMPRTPIQCAAVLARSVGVVRERRRARQDSDSNAPN